MPNLILMVGKEFNYLTIIKCIGLDRSGNRRYLCRCICGNETTALGCNIRKGDKISCGCKRIKINIKKYQYTYNSWSSMLQRCINKKHENYSNYGGRGIIVCERWKSFLSFLEDMGERPFNKTLERLNVNGNYSKDNCKWATMEEQRNNMRTNNNITFDGRTLSVTAWAKLLKIDRNTFASRLYNGWSFASAASTPYKIRKG